MQCMYTHADIFVPVHVFVYLQNIYAMHVQLKLFDTLAHANMHMIHMDIA